MRGCLLQTQNVHIKHGYILCSKYEQKITQAVKKKSRLQIQVKALGSSVIS